MATKTGMRARTKTAKKKSVKKKTSKQIRKAGSRISEKPSREHLVCTTCGRELVVDEWGTAERVVYCCGMEMKP